MIIMYVRCFNTMALTVLFISYRIELFRKTFFAPFIFVCRNVLCNAGNNLTRNKKIPLSTLATHPQAFVETNCTNAMKR